MARAILFGGIIVATGAAVADMVSSAMGETEKDLAASSMPAEPQAGEPMASTEAAVPGSTEGAAQDVAASGTSAEPQANDSMTTAAVTDAYRPARHCSVPAASEEAVRGGEHSFSVSELGRRRGPRSFGEGSPMLDRFGSSAVMTRGLGVSGVVRRCGAVIWSRAERTRISSSTGRFGLLRRSNAALTPAGIDRWLPAECPGSTPAPAGLSCHSSPSAGASWSYGLLPRSRGSHRACAPAR